MGHQGDQGMARLQGKVAIVTGAASGIGRASAILFAQEGASVVIADRSSDVGATAETIRAAGGRVVAVEADAGDEAAVASLVERAIKEFGGLDITYANAGIVGPHVPFLELSGADWQDVLRINLVGPFLAIKYSAKAFLAASRPGSIICTASVAGIRSGAGPTPYSASKAGVINLVQTTANQLAGTGIRVNAICPGLIETGMTKPVFDGARARGKEAKLGQLNPLRRYGVPTEIAGAALFLASDDSSYVNGQAIVVDGGLSSSHPVVPGRID
jgi:NAD(P)-dependent dehydrogenase (short-subunit alcohol dehydrogenase family)